MKYTNLAKELLILLEEDQREVRSYAKAYYVGQADKKDLQKRKDQLRKHSQDRARRMLEILNIIPQPTISNIGPEASEAIAVIALHSTLPIMKKVLELFTTCYKKDSSSVYYQVIPALTDRTLIIERRRQKFGSQWMQGEDGKPFLYPINDFKHVNDRRAKYGLGKLGHPRNLALIDPSKPFVTIPATYSEQRVPTVKEFQEYAGDLYKLKWERS